MPSQVFVCYSRKDDNWRRALREQFKPFERAGRLEVWDDTHIEAGEAWRDKIREKLATAQIGVLLVSPSFLASEFITHEEVPALLEAAVARGTRVLCVYVRPSLVGRLQYEYSDPTTGEWRRRLLTDFQGLNSPEQPLDAQSHVERGAAWARIAGAVLDVAEGWGADRVVAAPQVAPDPRPYLENLRNRTRRLDVRGLGAKVAEHMELERVYTRLRVTGARRSGEMELRDLLRASANLVLVGDPGAGKTTFLRFVALNLSRARLGEEREACLERLGLDGFTPFPVLVRLGDFGQFLRDKPDTNVPEYAAEHFYRHLDYIGRGVGGTLPETALRERVQAGDCWLLLDGLDEVPGEDMRVRVGQIIDEVVGAGRPAGNRHIVTCRTRAYQGKVQLGEEFTRVTLVDFGPREIEAFVTQWSRALFRVPVGSTSGAEAQQADEHCAELLRAIHAHPHVQPLTTNPLLLTILAVVHWSEKKLPEQRADLYEAAVKYLLEARDEQSPYGSTLRKDCLKAVAVRLFEDPQGVRRTLGQREAAETVAPLLGVEVARAVEFVEDEELHSGILVSRIAGEVEFWHLTFAEYLAAQALAWEPDYWDRVQGRLFDESWNELVLLLAGCLRVGGLRPASLFIQKILALDTTLAGRARAVGLVGRILRDILPAGGDPVAGTGFDVARHEVLAIFEPGSDVDERMRIEVGEALGQGGDPRLHDDDHANRVFIHGGTFSMGAQKADPGQPAYDQACVDRETPLHRVTVSDFWIDRYPVTVRQYGRFVEAGTDGYLGSRFWRPEGWSWREGAARTERRGWENQKQHPNRPVRGVSWYEAEAYCAWLAARTGRGVRLPTEAQWEYAARGEAERMYPWGNEEPTDQRANFAMRVGEPTPVGIYPLGATPEGVHDLAGNVWEWCADWYGPYSSEDQADPTGPTDGRYRLVRGGGFNRASRYGRAAYRNYHDPEILNDHLGFRCVVVGGSTQ